METEHYGARLCAGGRLAYIFRTLRAVITKGLLKPEFAKERTIPLRNRLVT